MRGVKYYEPEERRYGVENNLQCSYCGNTTAFFTNLKLKHDLTVEDGNLVVNLNEQKTNRILDSISRNIWRMIDRQQMEDKPIICCANCEEAESVDFQERFLDWCWQCGCPGCHVCGDFIAEEEVVSLCTQCIKEHDGKIEEDDCGYLCPNYDNGLLEVLDHYGMTLADVKTLAGY